jgi:hypothetical protein
MILWPKGQTRTLGNTAGRQEMPEIPLDDKQETRKQWNADPCGAVTAGELRPGSPELFGRGRQILERLFHRWGWYLVVSARR